METILAVSERLLSLYLNLDFEIHNVGSWEGKTGRKKGEQEQAGIFKHKLEPTYTHTQIETCTVLVPHLLGVGILEKRGSSSWC